MPVATARSPGRRDRPGRPARRCRSSPRPRRPARRDARVPRRATRAARGGSPAPPDGRPRAARPRPRRRTAARSMSFHALPRSTRVRDSARSAREQQRRVADDEHRVVGEARAARRDRSPRRARSRTAGAPSSGGGRAARAAAPRCATTRCGAPWRRRARDRPPARTASTLCTGPSQVIARSGSR